MAIFRRHWLSIVSFALSIWILPTLVYVAAIAIEVRSGLFAQVMMIGLTPVNIVLVSGVITLTKYKHVDVRTKTEWFVLVPTLVAGLTISGHIVGIMLGLVRALSPDFLLGNRTMPFLLKMLTSVCIMIACTLATARLMSLQSDSRKRQGLKRWLAWAAISAIVIIIAEASFSGALDALGETRFNYILPHVLSLASICITLLIAGLILWRRAGAAAQWTTIALCGTWVFVATYVRWQSWLFDVWFGNLIWEAIAVTMAGVAAIIYVRFVVARLTAKLWSNLPAGDSQEGSS